MRREAIIRPDLVAKPDQHEADLIADRLLNASVEREIELRRAVQNHAGRGTLKGAPEADAWLEIREMQNSLVEGSVPIERMRTADAALARGQLDDAQNLILGRPGKGAETEARPRALDPALPAPGLVPTAPRPRLPAPRPGR